MLEKNKLLLSTKEAREQLGISRSLFYRLIREGTMPIIRLGRAVRVPRQALEQLIIDESLRQSKLRDINKPG